MEIIDDFIINAETNEVYAQVSVHTVEGSPYRYEGELLTDHFPAALIARIQEYDDAANEMLFTLLDDIEKEINKFHLALRDLKSKVFTLGIYPDEGRITFYTKYPSGAGFLDDSPLNAPEGTV